MQLVSKQGNVTKAARKQIHTYILYIYILYTKIYTYILYTHIYTYICAYNNRKVTSKTLPNRPNSSATHADF